MKILLTGSTGFIGRNLLEGLTNHTILSPTRKQLDLLDETAVELYLLSNMPEVIIHCAGVDHPACLEENLRMFLNLYKYRENRKMIYFGSGAEYDRDHWLPKMKESYFGDFTPKDQYGFSKYLMNMLTQISQGIYNLRLFGVFGKYEDKYRFLYKCLNEKEIFIPRDMKFDYMYVKDLIPIVDWFITHNPLFKDFNVCTGKSYLLSEIAKMTGIPYTIGIKTEKEYSGDNSRLLKEKEFKFTPLEEALKENL